MRAADDTPRSMAKRSISSSSPNSFSIKTYRAHKIPHTNSRYCDERHKILVSASIFRFSIWIFGTWLEARLPRLSSADHFVFVFFFTYISSNYRQKFQSNRHNSPSTTKKGPRLKSSVKRLSVPTRLFSSKFAKLNPEKAFDCNVSITTGPARSIKGIILVAETPIVEVRHPSWPSSACLCSPTLNLTDANVFHNIYSSVL